MTKARLLPSIVLMALAMLLTPAVFAEDTSIEEGKILLPSPQLEELEAAPAEATAQTLQDLLLQPVGQCGLPAASAIEDTQRTGASCSLRCWCDGFGGLPVGGGLCLCC